MYIYIYNTRAVIFLIHINDIIDCSSILQLVLFADDTSAFILGLNYSDLFQVMNVELSELSGWFQVNKLTLNASKPNHMYVLLIGPK